MSAQIAWSRANVTIGSFEIKAGRVDEDWSAVKLEMRVGWQRLQQLQCLQDSLSALAAPASELGPIRPVGQA